MMIFSTQKNKRGFTLIEMLIAVFIFTVAISALTLMAGRGIRSANDSQNRITAEFLSIEGMEVVRNVRDSAFLAGLPETSWTGVFGGTSIFDPDGCFNALGDSNQNKTCAFIYDSSGVPSLSSCTACILSFDSNHVYSHSLGGEITPFSRKIYINEISQGEIRVRVTVQWGNEMIEYQENLFFWG